MKRFVLFILFIAIVFSGCEKEEIYSEIPSIKYLGFTANYEETELGEQLVGTLTFSFTDGDGDIGFYENSDSSITVYDVFITEYNKINDEFVVSDTIKYWMPYFEQGGLKGSIDIKLIRTIHSEDTAIYDFYIQDRAYNISNIGSTPEIIYSELIR